MSIVKTVSRKIIFPTIISFGMEKLLSAFSRQKRLILCYHGCNTNPDFNLNGRHISSNQFESHLLYLKKNFNVVSLEEMFQSYRGNSIPQKKTVALTFDDGYLNNSTVAFPLLKKYEVPATFFIVSNCLQNENYVLWPDVLDLIRTFSGQKKIEIGNRTFDNINGNLFSQELQISAYDYVKKMGVERDDIIEKLKSKYDFAALLGKTKIDNYKLINSEQLKKFSESPLVEIGSHTHSHYNLGNINENLARTELKDSKKNIENVIQKEVKTIAYPDGNYNENIKKLSVEGGYKNLVAVSYQCSDDLGDANILPRITISNTTTSESNMIQVNLGFKKRGF